jgi:Protein of unknown function (DUF1320)
MREPYITQEYLFLVSSAIAPGDLEALEAVYPGTFNAVARSWSRIFDSYLRKRYAAPFERNPDADEHPYPAALMMHLARVVGYELAVKRGYNHGSAQDDEVKALRNESMLWLKEASNALDGIPELPLRDTSAAGGDGAGVTKVGPLMLSDSDPYAILRPMGNS